MIIHRSEGMARMGQAQYLREVPTHMGFLDDLELGRGYFDGIASVEGGFLVSGWMLLPDKELGSLRVYWNRELLGSADVVTRQDVANAFRWIPHANRSGFSFLFPKPIAETTRVGRFDLLGCQDGRPTARMSTLFRADLDTAVPTPPQELMSMVAATRDAWFFKIGGLKSFGEFLDPICRHRELRSVRRLLDWGCGCGRVAVHFLSEPDVAEVFGCDVHQEAIQWCGENLRPGKFSRIEPWPPTPYEDAAFDVALGISVFTHLARDVQNAWLAEMRRIIAPGGLFLASTHGQFATRFEFPETFAQLLRDGIFDGVHDPSLGGIFPKGYYLNVYQTREYTLREWSKYFEILEYIERGYGNHQDLVVMRRPA